MYIVINKDLRMSAGKVTAHTAHASFDYLVAKYNELNVEGASFGEFLDEFKYGGDTIVILQASEKELLKWEKEGYVSVRDMGYTEVEHNSITAVNLGIYDKGEGTPKWIQRLRLYKG